jgi:dienelactone hydrolase
MFKPQPPTCKKYFIDLPLSRLHVMEAGEGEPLIIVPSHHFGIRELAHTGAVHGAVVPGLLLRTARARRLHTVSKDGFSSHKVAELVSQLADELGYERFNLMGFSFGGLLAMRTFKHLSPPHRPPDPDRSLPRPSGASPLKPQAVPAP